jgi:16S rRNA (uracil1498-N3)-methyltransferase
LKSSLLTGAFFIFTNMALPFFYIAAYDFSQKEIILDEDTSKHVVQVLRMKVGEQLNLTDGKGNLLTCEIKDDHKKHCAVEVKNIISRERGTRKVSIAISLLKNSNRFEWFLEKATELGVCEIIPLVCERTEKEKFRYDRMQGILISAMLQSQQVWLPELAEPVSFKKFIENTAFENKFIAHCIENDKRELHQIKLSQLTGSQICIGPEGDFTNSEIEEAIKKNFIPVGLGQTRLRTETAGVVAGVLLVNPVA